MRNSNFAENELNAIRINFYKKTKDMSPSERISYLKAQTEPVHEQYGINIVKKAKAGASV